MFALVQNDSVVFGPLVWNPSEFSRELAALGINASLPADPPGGALELPAGLKLLPVTVTQPAIDQFQALTGPVVTMAAAGITVAYTAVDLPLEEARTTALAQLGEMQNTAMAGTGYTMYQFFMAMTGGYPEAKRAEIMAAGAAAATAYDSAQAAISAATTVAECRLALAGLVVG